MFIAMNALHGTLSNSLPTCLSLASRKWIGGAGCRLVNFRPVVSTDPYRRQTAATQASQFDYSTSIVQRVAGNQGRRAFADYTFYKGKGAMCMKPGKPVFRNLDTGAAVLEKEGSLYLEFAPALGPRQYDWNRKQAFLTNGILIPVMDSLAHSLSDPGAGQCTFDRMIMALSVAELGTLVGLSMAENCEFYHDPYMGKSDAGKIRKILKVEPMPDHAGFFFNFYVSNKVDGSELKVAVGLSRAEYSVLRSSVNYLIPYLMGWHMVVDPSKVDEFLSEDVDSSLVNEWSR